MSVLDAAANVDYARLSAAVKHGEATAEEHVARYKEHGVPVDFWRDPVLDGTPDNVTFFQQDPQVKFYQGQAVCAMRNKFDDLRAAAGYALPLTEDERKLWDSVYLATCTHEQRDPADHANAAVRARRRAAEKV